MRNLIATQRVVATGIIVLAALVRPHIAQAQDTSSRAVKFIVPVPAGGITDVLARTLQDWLTRKWGQSIVIDNRPGAGGNLGTEAVFKADPDGSTMLISIPGPFTVNPTLYPNAGYYPRKDFAPIGLIGSQPSVLTVNPSLPVRPASR